MHRLTTMTFLFAAAPLAAQSAGPPAPPAPWLEACEIEGAGNVWCGTYEVWENREMRAGRRIGLNVVLLPATGENPAPDPLIWFIGGPGAPATIAARGLGQWTALRETRDILLVDQRGTGRSNGLLCREPAAERPLQSFFDEMLPPDYVRDCLARLQGAADVRLYTTPIAMDDMNEVRQELGYDRVNLMGGSYGTRAALIYLRRHGRHVRTAVLQGVAPTYMKNPVPFARALERGVAATIEACRAEPACHAAYPALAGDWERVKGMFAHGPVAAEVEHPETGERGTVLISQGVFADGIRHILYTVDDARALPLVIHAAAEGDFVPFAQREIEQAIGFSNLLADGMFLAVTCAEDIRFIEEADVALTAGTFLGDYRIRRQQQACRHWPVADIGPEYLEPVTVDVPVLIISGELDTATPWEGGQSVVDELPRGTHLLVPNQSHGNANPQCLNRIVLEFLVRGTIEGIATECVEATRRPAFTVPAP